MFELLEFFRFCPPLLVREAQLHLDGESKKTSRHQQSAFLLLDEPDDDDDKFWDALESEQEECDQEEQPSTSSSWSQHDLDLVQQAKSLMASDQVLAAARLVKQTEHGQSRAHPEQQRANDEHSPPRSADQAFCDSVLEKARMFEDVIADLLSPTEPGCTDIPAPFPETCDREWVKLGGNSSSHDHNHMYYRWKDDEHVYLQCRLESPLEASLFIPLLALLVETNLFTTWLPRWNYPVKMGLHTVTRLAHLGRTEQIVQLINQAPWPVTPVDAVVQTCACDDLHPFDEERSADSNSGSGNMTATSQEESVAPTTGTIAITLKSYEGGEKIHLGESSSDRTTTINNNNNQDCFTIPHPPSGHDRAEINGGFLIRPCPHGHPAVQENPNQQLLLFGFVFTIDAEIGPFFPAFVLDFLMKTVFRGMFNKLFSVAKEVRDGNRPQHAQAIQDKQDEVYGWAQERMEQMMAQYYKLHDQRQPEDEANRTTGSMPEMDYESLIAYLQV